MKKSIIRKMAGNLVILITFISVVICCTSILRNILWDNTNEMGLALVKNYSASEELNLHSCETILDIFTAYVDERRAADVSAQTLCDELQVLAQGITDSYGKDSLRFYAKLPDCAEAISNHPAGETLPVPDFTQAAWYPGAAALKGEIYPLRSTRTRRRGSPSSPSVGSWRARTAILR